MDKNSNESFKKGDLVLFDEHECAIVLKDYNKKNARKSGYNVIVFFGEDLQITEISAEYLEKVKT